MKEQKKEQEKVKITVDYESMEGQQFRRYISEKHYQLFKEKIIDHSSRTPISAKFKIVDIIAHKAYDFFVTRTTFQRYMKELPSNLDFRMLKVKQLPLDRQTIRFEKGLSDMSVDEGNANVKHHQKYKKMEMIFDDEDRVKVEGGGPTIRIEGISQIHVEEGFTQINYSRDQDGNPSDMFFATPVGDSLNQLFVSLGIDFRN